MTSKAPRSISAKEPDERDSSTAVLLYGVPFPLAGPGGKSAGTRRKIEALRGLAGKLHVYSPGSAAGPAGKAWHILRSELQTTWCLIRNRGSIDAFISRSIAGVLSVPLARLLGIRTVREIHADSIEEANILAKPGLRLVLLSVTARLAHGLDRSADVCVFNHPALARWYRERGWWKDADFVCYNGGKAPERIRTLEENQATRARIGIAENLGLLCFCGSMAPWHGIETLVALQQCFDRHGDQVKIICVGGEVPSTIDPACALLNITPADELECEAIAQAADACLLPVRNIRRSPGSPLKLFDYLLLGVPIIVQRDTEGYSDIVADFGAGFSTDFSDSEIARRELIEFLDCQRQLPKRTGDTDEVTWPARMRDWLTHIIR